MHLHHVLFITFATRRDNILPQNHISDTTSWQPWHTISAVYLCSYIHVEIYCHCAIYHCSYAIYLRYHIPSKGALSLSLSLSMHTYIHILGRLGASDRVLGTTVPRQATVVPSQACQRCSHGHRHGVGSVLDHPMEVSRIEDRSSPT